MSLNSDHNSHQLLRQINDNVIEYEVDEQLAFVPRKIWHGGVHYKSVFTTVEDGCDVTVDAPFFNSVNRWRIVEEVGGDKVISIFTDAKCGKAFASPVRKFLEKSHEELRAGFVSRLGEIQPATNAN